MRWLRVSDGEEIGYRLLGTGSNHAVLLHGFGSDGVSDWLSQRCMTALEGLDYQFAVPDLRGHGGSRRLASLDTDVHRVVADIVELIDALGWRSCVVVGRDVGADLAVLVAENDDRIVGLFLVAPMKNEVDAGLYRSTASAMRSRSSDEPFGHAISWLVGRPVEIDTAAALLESIAGIEMPTPAATVVRSVTDPGLSDATSGSDGVDAPFSGLRHVGDGRDMCASHPRGEVLAEFLREMGTPNVLPELGNELVIHESNVTISMGSDGKARPTLLVLSGVPNGRRSDIAMEFERLGISVLSCIDDAHESVFGDRPDLGNTAEGNVTQIPQTAFSLLEFESLVVVDSTMPVVDVEGPLDDLMSWCRHRSVPVVHLRLVHDCSITTTARSGDRCIRPGDNRTELGKSKRGARVRTDSRWITLGMDELDPSQLAKIVAPVLDGRQSSMVLRDLLETRSALANLGSALRVGDERWSCLAFRAFADIQRQLSIDRSCPGVLDAWTQSSMVDIEGRVIVERETAEILHKIVGMRSEGNLGHAGILHTYGYLTSTEWTTHGWKRDRWVNGDVAATLNIDPRLLGANPHIGTLLSNLTLGLSALTGIDHIGDVSSNLGIDLGAMNRILVTETVEATSKPTIPATSIVFRTYLWRLLAPPQIPEPSLLVYTVEDEAGERLVTAFPVTDTYRNLLIEGEFDGRIRPQYNYRPADEPVGFFGTRTVE